VRRNGETAMGGRYATRRMVLTPGADSVAPGMSLTALKDRFDSDGVLPPGLNYCLRINSISNSLDDSLLVNILTRLCMISWCISKFTLSWPSSVSPNLFNHTLQVYLQTCMISISMFAPSRPPSASLHLLDDGLQLYLKCRSITCSM
jgi:hypothetical protein